MSGGRRGLLVHGARKLDADGTVDDFWFAAVDGEIVQTGSGSSWREHSHPLGTDAEPPVVHDARGRWLTPGFIDLHSHGGAANAFDDGPAAIQAAVALHRAHGTTRTLVSLVANPVDSLVRSLSAIADLVDDDPLILGAHLEGPFLAPDRRGAHNAEFLIDPHPAAVERLIAASRGTLRQITLAPELDGALEAVDVLVEAGVVVAVGHTEASDALAGTAFDRGARLVTHAFNAMPGIHHRRPGPVVAAFADDRVVLELILDGEHVHPDVARLAFTAAPGRIALITDAMAAAGSADGAYRLGSLDVTVTDGLALVSGTDTIAGSTLTQDRALRVAISSAGVDPRAAVEALTLTPARVLGRDHDLGRLAVGYRADAVLLDAEWRVETVWADGSVIG